MTEGEDRKMNDFMFSAGMLCGALGSGSFRFDLQLLLENDRRTRHYLTFLRDKLSEVLGEKQEGNQNET